MRRSGFPILESLSALAVEGRQEAFLTDPAVHIRDNRIPGIYVCARAQEAFRGYGDIDMQTMIILLILLCRKYIVRINLFPA